MTLNHEPNQNAWVLARRVREDDFKSYADRMLATTCLSMSTGSNIHWVEDSDDFAERIENMSDDGRSVFGVQPPSSHRDELDGYIGSREEPACHLKGQASAPKWNDDQPRNLVGQVWYAYGPDLVEHCLRQAGEHPSHPLPSLHECTIEYLLHYTDLTREIGKRAIRPIDQNVTMESCHPFQAIESV